VTPDDERQQAWRKEVRAFGLVAAALTNPVPKLLEDLTVPEETLRSLEREPPLVYFSPFGALPKDIAYDRGEPVHPPTGTHDLLTEREVARSDAGWSGTPDLPHAASSEARPPVFSFRRRDRSVQEGSVDADAARGHSRVPGAAPGESANPAYPDPSASERSEMTYVSGNEGFAGSALQPAVDPMSLLDDLAENVLGTGKRRARDVPAHPANTPPQAVRLREPGREAHGGDKTADPVYPAGRGSRWEEESVAATDLRKAGSEDGGVNALFGSLAEDLFSFPVRTPGEPAIPEHSAFAPPAGASDGPADGFPPGVSAPGTDDGMTEKVPGQYADPEAFAEIINDVLVRQARRHGVDLS
jgi:hypothetical protein